MDTDQLVTFFRISKLKKFYLNQGSASAEVTFFHAARLLECGPDTPRRRVPDDYPHRLETNKQRFEQDTIQAEEPVGARSGGRSNLSYIDKRLKDKAFRNYPKFTDADEELIEGSRRMVDQGTMAKKVAQTIKKQFQNLACL